MERVTTETAVELEEFLRAADLTVSALDAPEVALWLQRSGGRIIASSGFELSADGRAALIRSVAVDPAFRRSGQGTALAVWALREAAARGAREAWLFSRRSGPFWQKLGFKRSTTLELADALAGSAQVEHFRATGRLDGEVAWWRALPY
ncbi:GNAT family N-acetyltransferase [Microbacteriaceae bacterium VKM Ac-2854]|nr:GNAT family N-acetyltransferase [Microbacteriaceae bacterium VKM Ac-2854]